MAGEAAQRVNREMADARNDRLTNGQSGAPPPETAGGGVDGHFVFTDVAELDDVITRLDALRSRVRERGVGLGKSLELVAPPANDLVSSHQAVTTRRSLAQAWEHNATLLANVIDYLARLRQARVQVVGTDTGNAHNFARQDRG